MRERAKGLKNIAFVSSTLIDLNKGIIPFSRPF